MGALSGLGAVQNCHHFHERMLEGVGRARRMLRWSFMVYNRVLRMRYWVSKKKHFQSTLLRRRGGQKKKSMLCGLVKIMRILGKSRRLHIKWKITFVIHACSCLFIMLFETFD